jgi:hypothetical protein
MGSAVAIRVYGAKLGRAARRDRDEPGGSADPADTGNPDPERPDRLTP